MRQNRSALLVLILGMFFFLSACADSTPPLIKGKELMRTGSYDKAVTFYMERLSESPKSIEARLNLVRALRAAAEQHAKRGVKLEKGGRLDAALMEYRRSLEYNTEESLAKQGVDRVRAKLRAQELLTKGKDLFDEGEVREATYMLDEAMDLDPENTEIQDAYQEAAEQLQQTADEAIRASELAPTKEAMSLLSTKPVTLRFKETDIKDVLEIISKLGQVNILVDEGVRAKKVTSYITDLPLRQAFTLILNTNRLFAKQINDNSLVVIPDTPAKHRQYDELQVRTFYLSNAQAKRIVNLLRTILSTRQIFVDEELNAITVRDTPKKIALAERLIHLNDRGGGEVEIDLELLEVDQAKLTDFGITFTDTYTAGFFLGELDLISPAILGGASLAEDFFFTNPQIFLDLLKNDREVKVLANPTLRVLDRQKATIVIAENRPFAVSTTTTSPGGTTEAGTVIAGTTAETRVEFRDVGLTLSFTPIIHLNGEVTIEISFEISQIAAQELQVGNELQPTTNRRTLNTFITLRDGESRLLGGLIQDEERKTVVYSPFLGDLPLIGTLFRETRTEKIRTDVLISITLRVVKRLEPPHPDLSTFWAGTGQSFEGGPVSPARAPARRPRPARTPARPSPQQ
ncbi:MAG: secretin N-terminal domain-containing protein [Candidatus Methylomirabilales bacterium]